METNKRQAFARGVRRGIDAAFELLPAGAPREILQTRSVAERMHGNFARVGNRLRAAYTEVNREQDAQAKATAEE